MLWEEKGVITSLNNHQPIKVRILKCMFDIAYIDILQHDHYFSIIEGQPSAHTVPQRFSYYCIALGTANMIVLFYSSMDMQSRKKHSC